MQLNQERTSFSPIPFVAAAFALTVLIILCPPVGRSQAGDETKGAEVIRANYELASRFTANDLLTMVQDVAVKPVWLGGDDRFWYAVRTGTAFRFFIVDPGRKTRTETPVDITILGQNLVEFTIAGRMYRFDIVTQDLTRVPAGRAPFETWETPSPDGKMVAYARSHNLVVAKTGNPGRPEQITSDGGPFYSFSLPEEPFYAGEGARTDDSLRPAEVLWAPDSRKLVAIREDVRSYSDFWVINSLGAPHPDLITFKQRFPGGDLGRTEVWIYDAARNSLLQVRADKWSPSVYEHIVWSRDSKTFYMVRKSPDMLEGELLRVDASTGRFEVLLTEKIDALVLTKPVVLLPDGEGFLWWSRRDGHGHFYRCDLSGRAVKQVTAGPFNVADALGIDRDRNLLYFTANGAERRRNPYYDHLYSVSLNGGDIKPLTYEDAHHEVFLSPSCKYLVDNFSRVDQPLQAVLKDSDGNFLMELESTDISRLVEAGWKEPEVFHVKAADGETDLWGVMYKPYDFDPGRRYPIISFVYPGPQDELVPLTFIGALGNNAHLAQYGFIVVHAGNRGGSYKRSLEYSEYFRGNLRDYPVADNKAVIENLARRHEWIDADRVGIWGGSSGAYAALTGMLTYPEFYKVCVARSGPHDPSIYHAWWSDEFQGMLKIVQEDGTVKWITEVAEGNLELAHNLEGRLLLLQSEMDDNVHPAHAARMARALMAANKRFDYFVVPGAGHAWGGNWNYVQQMIWTYFVHHLMGDQRWNIDIFEDFESGG
jgi:dipeptidyl-peptidase-4